VRRRSTHRQEIVRIARSLDGLSASHTPAEFRLALGIPPAGGGFDLSEPFTIDPDGTTHGVSTCALVAREILHRAGVAIPSLDEPYVIASGISDVVAVARERGALENVPNLQGIKPGDLILYADHVATVVSVGPPGVMTVDGGMTDDHGLQAIGTNLRPAPYAQPGQGLPIAYIRTTGLPWKWSE